MALVFGDGTVQIDGVCGVDEAMPLLEFLQTHGEAGIDMRTCTHLHSAALQVLMIVAIRVVALPDEAFLAQWLMPLFGSNLVAIT
jgi:hypothetical protein